MRCVQVAHREKHQRRWVAQGAAGEAAHLGGVEEPGPQVGVSQLQELRLGELRHPGAPAGRKGGRAGVEGLVDGAVAGKLGHLELM